MQKNSICFITNIAPHYRFPIFHLMDQQLQCDFYIGDRVESPIKTFDYTLLKHYRKTLHNHFLGHFYWQSGSIGKIFSPYNIYILDGEPYCISAWLILILAKILGKKTIAWTHGWYGKERGLRKLIKKTHFRLFSKIMLYNEYSKKLMADIGFDEKRLYCIANSLDTDHNKELRGHLSQTDIYKKHFNNEYPTIIYCGRIQKSKKLGMILDAMRLLKEEGHNLNAIFVGKDVDQVNLQGRISELGLDAHTWLYGPCYDDKKLSELFYNAHLCVSPGNVGLTAIHALSYGCPVVTHDSFPYQGPESEAIRPGITGDFFKYDDLADLVRLIKKWISVGKEQRTNIHKAAFEEIDRKWNIHNQIETLKKITNDCEQNI